MQTEHYMANMDRPGRGLDGADDAVAPDRAPPPTRDVPSTGTASSAQVQAPTPGDPVTRRS